MLKSARTFKCSLDHVKAKFYRFFNVIYFRAKNASTEIVCVHLLRSVCVPLLIYAVDVLPLTKADISTLNRLIDRALLLIFGSGSVEDIAYIRTAVYLK